MSAFSQLTDRGLPLLAVVLLLIALRRQPPAGRMIRLMGGLFVSIVSVGLLGRVPGLISDPSEAAAMLVCLAMAITFGCIMLVKPDLS